MLPDASSQQQEANLYGGLQQALPLVSTFWGVVIFGEYRRASKKTYGLLAVMLLMFAAAVGLLMGSSGHRNGN